MATSIPACSRPRTLLTTLLLSPPSSSLIVAYPSFSTIKCPSFSVFRAAGSHGASDPALLRRPSVDFPYPHDGRYGGDSPPIGEEEVQIKEEKEEGWVDWEDKILDETVPIVGFVRTVLHSGKYSSGDHLSSDDEKTILEKLLIYHPEYTKKIGCGIDFITIGFHPDFQNSRCLFIVRKDGELVDFSFWKCIKGYIKKKYPLYADSFILRHFRRRGSNSR